jgi:hypothetical protein
MPSFFINRSSSLLGRFFFLSDGFADVGQQSPFFVDSRFFFLTTF